MATNLKDEKLNCRVKRSYQSLAFHNGYVYYEKHLSIPKMDMANYVFSTTQEHKSKEFNEVEFTTTVMICKES